MAVVQEKSIARASKRLYMTPQGISKIVRNLEAEMDCRLFTRESTGMALTESGERFLEYAKRILRRHIKDWLEKIRNGEWYSEEQNLWSRRIQMSINVCLTRRNCTLPSAVSSPGNLTWEKAGARSFCESGEYGKPHAGV